MSPRDRIIHYWETLKQQAENRFVVQWGRLFSNNYICASFGESLSDRDVHNSFEGGMVLQMTDTQVWKMMKENRKTGKIGDSALLPTQTYSQYRIAATEIYSKLHSYRKPSLLK